MMRALQWIGPLHIVGGLLVFLTGLSIQAQIIFADWFVSGTDVEWSPFLAAVFGPTVASWGVLFTGVAHQYRNTRSMHLWWTMVASLAVWAPLDTLLCLKFGLTSGVVLNLAVASAMAIILYSVRPSAIR